MNSCWEKCYTDTSITVIPLSLNIKYLSLMIYIFIRYLFQTTTYNVYALTSCLCIKSFSCYSIYFIYKYNCWGIFFSQSEHISHHTRSFAQVLLDKFGTNNSYEGSYHKDKFELVFRSTISVLYTFCFNRNHHSTWFYHSLLPYIITWNRSMHALMTIQNICSSILLLFRKQLSHFQSETTQI